MKYPMNECSDCIHRDGCKLLAKARFWANRNPFIDLSEAHCKQYAPDYVTPEDMDWEKYLPANKDASKKKGVTYDELKDNEYFLILDDAIGISELDVSVIILSQEFMNNMLPEQYKNTGTIIKTLFNIPVELNNQLGLDFIIRGIDIEDGEAVELRFTAYLYGDEEDDDDGN